MHNTPGKRFAAHFSTPHHLSAILKLHCGGAPALLIDRHGIIAAANTKAASLLNRTVSELVGQPFGHWVSSLECADLDVVRYADGKLSTRIVHARRLEHLATGAHTIVTLSEQVTVANTPLPDVVGEALARVHNAYPHLRPAITVTGAPAVTVTAEASGVIASWIQLLFHLAGIHSSHLTIRCGLRHGGWVGLDFSLAQSTTLLAHPRPIPRPTDQRLLDVRRIGGDFRLLIEDPKIQLDLWIPHQLDSAPGI